MDQTGSYEVSSYLRIIAISFTIFDNVSHLCLMGQLTTVIDFNMSIRCIKNYRVTFLIVVKFISKMTF